MKRLLVLVLAAGLLTGAAAWPGWAGGRGLFRVQDARSEGYWNGSLMVRGFYANWPGERWEPGQAGFAPGTALDVEEATVALSLSPVKWFELFCWSGAVRESAVTGALDSAFYGYHGLAPGIKLSIPVIPVVKLGVMGTYGRYPILDDYRGDWSWGRFSAPFVNGISWAGLVTFDLSKKLPLLHVNYGQATDTDEEAAEGGETKYTSLGAALEYGIGKLDLFAEFSSVSTGGSPLDNAGMMRVTPGIKVGYLKPLILEAGASIGLTDSTAPLELTAGLGLAGRLFVPRKPTTGAIAGRVIDAATGRPLAASVSFPALTKPGPQTTERAKGTFKAKGVRPGTVVVRAAAQGFAAAEQSVIVTAGMTAHVEFALQAEKTTGSIAGSVTDPSTGAPLQARIELLNTSVGPANTDAEGAYSFADLPAGDYTVQASAEGYMTATTPVTVVAKQEARADFQLVRAGVSITLKVYFDFDKATLKPESHDALAAAAKIMNDNPTIRVEIQGHTDNVGTAAYNSRLSRRRAQAVVDYLVTNLGIARARLTARGFGFDNPAATNDTEEGRAQNRRVEFLVLE